MSDLGLTPFHPRGPHDDTVRPHSGKDGASSAASLASPDATKRMQEIARLLGPGSAPATAALQGLPVPALDAPLMDCAPEDMITFIGAIIAKTQEGQMRTAREGIDVSQRKSEERHTAAMAKIKDWIQKTKDADSNSGPGGVFGWMKRIGGPAAAFIGLAVAIAATVATGGAGAPLLLGVLALGIVGSSMALASQIAMEAGYDQPLDVSYWLAKGYTAMLTEGFDVEGEDAVNGGKMLSGAIPILALIDPKILGNLAGGAAGFAGADETQTAIVEGTFAVVATVATMVVGMGAASKLGKAADAVDKLSKFEKGAQGIATYGRVVQSSAAVSNGTASVGSGTIDAMKAGDQRDATLAQADKQAIQATIQRIQRLMEEEREALKKVMDEMANVTSVITAVLADSARTRSQIASATPHPVI